MVESDPQFPFFIEWDGAVDELDGRYGAAATAGVAWVDVGGDEDAVRDWVGDETVPIRVTAGRRGPQRFALRTRQGTEIIIE